MAEERILEDLTTWAPFRGPDSIRVPDEHHLQLAFEKYANAEARVLALITPSHSVAFGIGAPFSFVDSFDWRAGQSVSARSRNPQGCTSAVSFRGQGAPVEVQPEWLLPLADVLDIVAWIFRCDERPDWVEWRLSP